jgi:hypothetical protein
VGSAETCAVSDGDQLAAVLKAIASLPPEQLEALITLAKQGQT